MKIAILGHKRIPSREGGIEVVVEELATRLVERGHQVTVYNRGGQHISGEEFGREISIQKGIYKGIIIKTVPTIKKKGLAAITGSFFGAVSAAFGKFDVVHFHAEGPSFMCWLPRLTGKRVIVTIHGLDHQRGKWGRMARAYIMHGEKAAVKYANEIIVLSKDVQKYFDERYHRETVWIPNGVTKPSLTNVDVIYNQFNLVKNEYFLYLGRLVPEKGIHYLIQAFRKTKTNKKLVIAGGSSDTDEYQEKLRRMATNDNRIIFTGFVQGKLLAGLYSNAYVYILPSDLEGMPLSLLEAMSYGNCCLTSDIAECREVVEKYAITFKKGNVNDLAEKLQILCDNTETVSHYKEDAADYILNKYSWEKTTDLTEHTYKNKGSKKRRVK